jgi:hypothetical protein
VARKAKVKLNGGFVSGALKFEAESDATINVA